LDLCGCLGHPTPADADPTGDTFCFEKGASKQGGGEGFADVWKKDFFGWEYKGKHKDLAAAYDQLLMYRDALASPPLLVVCDLDRIVVHTNFTKTVSATHEIALGQLGEPRSLEILRAVFHNPEALRPGRTSAAVTQDAARHFAEIAAAMRQRGLDPAAVAHFLDRIVFCLFAEDTLLLPNRVFTRIVDQSRGDPARFGKILGQLFDTMASGGDFGLESIRHFNGNLFDDRTVLDLTADEMKRIAAAAELDWRAVDPSIFGTLFERGLDPAKRAQLGAHFTSREDIELVVDAVVMTVLRREWDECRQLINNLLATGKKKPGAAPASPEQSRRAKPLSSAAIKKARGEAGSILHRFLDRLQHVRILDPACGSGNFLYVALLRLKDLEKEASLFGNDNGLGAFLPWIGPWQLHGIEINPYAHDLAQMTVWIGWLQWIRVNGFGFPADPILRPLSDNIRLMDAIVSENGDPACGGPVEPEWPTVDFIIGNPPFLGDKLMRRELGDAYVDRLRSLYEGRIPGQSDLCCYWFEKARAQIVAGKCKRAGLLATQGIRGGANREVLKRIKESGDIFWAESDRPWILNGANVHVSMVGFDDKTESTHTLDGKSVATINANLTAAADTVTARRILANGGISYQGPVKVGKFDIGLAAAKRLLGEPNPHGRPNSDVVCPLRNGQDITSRSRESFVVDFFKRSLEDASLFQKPFAHVTEFVKPLRDRGKREGRRLRWWQHGETGDAMRVAFAGLLRYVATTRVAKHRIFAWLPGNVLPDSALIVFARSDDLFFGILHSRIHEVWALRMGTRLETRPRYTPSTCFETFSFPSGVLDNGHAVPAHAAISAAAKELNALRENWLNPPEWTHEEILEFPGTVGGPWDRYIDPATVSERGAFKIGTVKYLRIVPRAADCAARLKERTLTKLYNERPAWLADAHRKLDVAVAAAYGWGPGMSDEEILKSLLSLNATRSGVAGGKT
ncbi:MAG: class I SAM-dependent DNA methyltransferase, partial [Lentisphaerae bacterium]|nr:class I SAM-dependent DNA methyltransferase [Lentisphaerota bacterium]